jgi:hypothetical protein
MSKTFLVKQHAAVRNPVSNKVFRPEKKITKSEHLSSQMQPRVRLRLSVTSFTQLDEE